MLWGLSGPATLFGIEIPGYMFWVAVLYSGVGSTLAHLVGRPLIPLHFNQQRVSRPISASPGPAAGNAEGIALYGGEADGSAACAAAVSRRCSTMAGHMVATQAALPALPGLLGQWPMVFSLLVASPRYFIGRIHLAA